MKLPNREKAFIPEDKLKKYLLSETHSVGKSKAEFFFLIGFSLNSLEVLEHALLAIARTEDVKESVPSTHGVKYVIDGILDTPRGRKVNLRTIWIIDEGKDSPRFVTAYPA